MRVWGREVECGVHELIFIAKLNPKDFLEGECRCGIFMQIKFCKYTRISDKKSSLMN